VVVDRIDAEADDFRVAFNEFGLEARDTAEFGCADGREILGMRKQHGQAVADLFVETNRALGRCGGEVRRNGVDA
jgi:hypothetical protein